MEVQIDWSIVLQVERPDHCNDSLYVTSIDGQIKSYLGPDDWIELRLNCREFNC